MLGNNEAPYFTIQDKKSRSIYRIKLEDGKKLICVDCPNKIVCPHILNFVSNKEIIKNVKKFIGITPDMIKDVERRRKLQLQ